VHFRDRNISHIHGISAQDSVSVYGSRNRVNVLAQAWKCLSHSAVRITAHRGVGRVLTSIDLAFAEPAQPNRKVWYC